MAMHERLRALAAEARELWVPSSETVERRSCIGLDPHSFFRDFVARSVPVVLEDGMDEWAARANWTSWTGLRSAVGDSTRVSVNYTPAGLGDHVEHGVFVKPERRVMEFAEFCRQLCEKDYSAGVPYLSEQNDSLRLELPALMADVIEPRFAPAAFGAEADAVNLWIGDEASTTVAHRDYYENLYFMVSGSKQFTLLAPTDLALLERKWVQQAQYEYDAATSEWRTCFEPESPRIPWITSDITDAAALRVLAPEAPAVRITLRAGEMLYLPCNWVHAVQHVASSAPTVAVNYWYSRPDYFISPVHVLTDFVQQLALSPDVAPGGQSVY
ncbi:JmjC domain-containing protein 7 [Porphyridium purpureum]|uniref:JmjC domain-containing protein 7 n=1 Tax=Porphyridium purpureum TaxID=35688 RepID=A0A5J4Z2J2_PORPP|nr:JmjC domain-containing protein 7 [Porphyridium purpureum]|eukprot:POR3333..scf208_2